MNVYKSIPLLFVAFLFSIITSAQDSTTMSVSSGTLDAAPIKWTVGFEKINDTQIKLLVKGEIPKTWHIYATDVVEELAGPVVFIDDSTLSAEKLVISSKTATINDEVFENKQKLVYQDSLVFTQLVTCNAVFPAAIKILLKYEAASGNNFITD